MIQNRICEYALFNTIQLQNFTISLVKDERKSDFVSFYIGVLFYIFY